MVRGCFGVKWMGLLLIGLAFAAMLTTGCALPYRTQYVAAEASSWRSDPQAAALLGEPAYRGARLSPDGRRILAIQSTPREDSIVLFSGEDFRVRTVLTTERRRTRGLGASRRVRQVGWAGDERPIFSIETALLSSEDGIVRPEGRNYSSETELQRGRGRHSRKTRLYRLDFDGSKRYLGSRWEDGPESQYQDLIVDWLSHDPVHFLIEFEGHLIRVNAQTGARYRLGQGRTFEGGWVIDHRGEPRASFSLRDHTRDEVWRYREPGTGRWRDAIRYDRFTEKGFSFVGFSPTAPKAYVTTAMESDRVHVRTFDLETGKIGEVLAKHPAYDLGSGPFWFSKKTGQLITHEYYGFGTRRVWFDRDFLQSWQLIPDRLQGRNVDWIDLSADDQRVLVRTNSPTHPPQSHVLDRADNRLIHVFDERPELDPETLHPYESFLFEARDGNRIPAVLVRPEASRANGALIVMVHDGPEGQVYVGFDGEVQYLVHRGYHVLLPDFRGSSGYGSRHLQAGDGELGGTMTEDVIDSVAGLRASGKFDPAIVGVFGTGYGGLLALNSVIQAPEIFSAAATWGALTDLELHEARRSRLFRASEVDDIIHGDGDEYRARRRASSPARNAEQLQGPIFLGHAEEDDRVDVDQLVAMSKALAAVETSFEATVYEAQTADFLDARARVDFFTRLADFFDRSLVEDARSSSEPAFALGTLEASR